jgi:ubiquitin-protein ligase
MVAELRVRRDIEDLAVKRYSSGSTDVFVSLPKREKSQILIPVSIIVKNIDNPYYGAVFEAVVRVTPEYPFHPPEVHISNKVYHPNVDIDTGKMIIQALSWADWLPVMTLNSVIFAVELCLIEPNLACVPDNPINRELAHVYSTNKAEFAMRVGATLRGGTFFGDRIRFAENYGARNTLKRNVDETHYESRKARKTKDSMLIEDCVYY